MKFEPTLSRLLSDCQNLQFQILYTKTFMKKDSDYQDDIHLHDYYEIYVYLNGDVSFRVKDDIYSMEYGDMILTRPNELHRCLYHGDSVHEHFCIWIKGMPVALFRETPFADQVHLRLSDDNKKKLIAHCFACYYAMNAKVPSTASFGAAHHFFGILDIICTGEQQKTPASVLPTRFTDLLIYISRHFQESDCNVTRLSEHLFISKSQMNRYFSTYFQTTPSAYIESCRMVEAKRLLQVGQSVQSAARQCGFSDCSYFVLRFRKNFGMTPLQYQKRANQYVGRESPFEQ